MKMLATCGTVFSCLLWTIPVIVYPAWPSIGFQRHVSDTSASSSPRTIFEGTTSGEAWLDGGITFQEAKSRALLDAFNHVLEIGPVEIQRKSKVTRESIGNEIQRTASDRLTAIRRGMVSEFSVSTYEIIVPHDVAPLQPRALMRANVYVKVVEESPSGAKEIDLTADMQSDVLSAGDPLLLSISVSEPCQLTIYHVQGDSVTILLPGKYGFSTQIDSGMFYVFPPVGFELRATLKEDEASSFEYFVIVAVGAQRKSSGVFPFIHSTSIPEDLISKLVRFAVRGIPYDYVVIPFEIRPSKQFRRTP